jgi:type II secretory pathway component PulF
MTRTLSGVNRRAILENLSMLVTAGVDATSALRATAEGVTSSSVRAAIARAQKHVDGGGLLSEALTQEGMLTPHQVWLVRIGEESGTLAMHLETVVAQERRDELFRGRLQAAMLYPLIVVAIGLIVGLGVSWLVLPRLVTVFTGLNTELPLMTKALLGLGTFLSESGYWFVPAVIALVGTLGYLLFMAKATRWIGQGMLLRTPGIGRLIREIELARFGYVFGSLLEVGVPMEAALAALTGPQSYDAYSALFEHLHSRIAAGDTLAGSLSTFKGAGRLIPTAVQQVLITAEQSARMTQAATHLGEAYGQRLEVTAKNLVAMLEPLMLFIVWLGVVLLAAAVMTPIYSVLQGINR